MTKKYANCSGGAPTSEIVHVPDYAPVHVYRSDFIKQVTHLLSDPNLMSDALWEYNPQLHRETGERVYAEMNTGDFWKLGDAYVANQLNSLDPSE
jgi:hypothetical protein